jgi:hypothetical protein
MTAFLRDRCTVRRDLHVSVDDLWAAWKVWAEDQSQHHGTKQTFGRDLRAVVPGLHVSRPRDGEHKRAYVGLTLGSEGNNVADRGPRGPYAPEDAGGPHGPRTTALFARQPAEGARPDTDEADRVDEASATIEVAREALRIFEDDLTDESAARLKAMVDGADSFGWGELA